MTVLGDGQNGSGAMGGHRIVKVETEMDDGETVIESFEIECNEPVGAWCRMHCPDGCEEWGPDHDHKLTDYGQCLAVECFDACGSIECGPDDLPPDTAPIGAAVDVEWDDVGWIWYLARSAVSS